jgi:hypothetical protein
MVDHIGETSGVRGRVDIQVGAGRGVAGVMRPRDHSRD